jgi:uncharacterized protein YjbI with pentapeptide repeats
MTNFIKSKVQQSLSFLLMLVIAFSAFSGVLLVNPSPSYAFNQNDLNRALSGEVNLSGADLSGANLHLADLSGANLRRANLRNADLSNAYLLGADLSEADLSEVDLSAADLTSVSLRGADLRGADLSKVDSVGDLLSEVDFANAIANRKTKFPDGFNAVDARIIFRN